MPTGLLVSVTTLCTNLYIKEKSTDFASRTWEDPSNTITARFNGLGKETLVAVFRPWMERLKWVLKNKRQH
jgi:hypothetical protein